MPIFKVSMCMAKGTVQVSSAYDMTSVAARTQLTSLNSTWSINQVTHFLLERCVVTIILLFGESLRRECFPAKQPPQKDFEFNVEH